MRRFSGVSVPPAGLFAHTVNAQRREAVTRPLTCLTLDQALEQVSGYRLNGLSPEAAPTPRQPSLAAEDAIHLDGLSFGYQPSQPILHDLSLRVPSGQFVAITGDNGAGKTTLARHLIGLLRPAAGRALLFGQDIARQPVSALARKVGYAFQNPELQIFNPTVREEIAFGPRNLGLSGDALNRAVDAALDHFGLAALADHPPAMLSFSGRRLVALAGIAAMNTPILVLDEPTVGLDADGQARVGAWLSDRRASGTTILLITHDMELAARYADRALVMQAGRFAADGSPREVFARAELLAGAGLEPPFAAGFAARLGRPDLAADLTPDGAARTWLEHLV
jgi:energy-coupling factor transport system ATP-binding protein